MTEVTGCRGLAVRAIPRKLSDSPRLGRYVPGGASELELVADAERGVLLRLEARVEGGPFLVIELVEVHFDEVFADDVFVFQPPPGEEVRPHGELPAMPEAMSLEEAARRAPFTVLAPRRLPAGWGVNAIHVAGRDRPPTKPSVMLHLVDPAGLHQFCIGEISLPPGTVVATVIRGGEPHVPGGSFPLQAGDEVILVSEGATEKEIQVAFQR
jgi:hypothetical protein